MTIKQKTANKPSNISKREMFNENILFYLIITQEKMFLNST